MEYENEDAASVSDAEHPDDLPERVRQLREWLEQEVRVLSVDDVSEDERERMEERAETARALEGLFAAL